MPLNLKHVQLLLITHVRTFIQSYTSILLDNTQLKKHLHCKIFNVNEKHLIPTPAPVSTFTSRVPI